MRTRFYFSCATLSDELSVNLPLIYAAAISAVHFDHSSFHFAPAVPASFQSLQVHATRTPPQLFPNLTVTGCHHALIASLIRTSFRLAGHFHHQLFHSPSLSVASLHSSFSSFTAGISQPHGSICRLFRQSLGVTCHPASSPLPSRRLHPQ